ncbi:MAG: VanZ family protein [Oscillospiraceae bacterium]|nr:VanZ family protein [Oscillospiraceae bacterium]
MLTIFFFSSQNGEQSGNLSMSITDEICSIIYHNHEVTEQNKEMINHIIRKGAHFTIYLIGGIIAFNLLNTFNLTLKRKIVYAQIICSAYAITDEFHQVFSAGRTPAVGDVLIDSAGALVGILIFAGLYYKIRRKKYVEET